MSPTTRRARNRRGEGDLLRSEIVSAAERLVEQAGNDEALTLRAIAREAGISAPSIYAHFEDRQAVLDAVLDAGYARLRQAIADQMDALGGTTDPVRRLLAGCHGYVDFAMREPASYQLLFSRGRPSVDAAAPTPGPDHTPPTSDSTPPDPDWAPPIWRHRLDAFRLLVDSVTDCVAAGRSTSTDPFADATALWTAMHGAVSLRQYLPNFPWPSLHRAVDRFAVELAHITPS